jgi:hypothetical protein
MLGDGDVWCGLEGLRRSARWEYIPLSLQMFLPPSRQPELNDPHRWWFVDVNFEMRREAATVIMGCGVTSVELIFRAIIVPELNGFGIWSFRSQIVVFSNSSIARFAHPIPTTIDSTLTYTKLRLQPSESNPKLMESSLHQVWESAVGNPFEPSIGKGSQFFVGITLLIIGVLLSGFFGLS